MIKKASNRVSFPEIEKDILHNWKEKDILKKSIDKSSVDKLKNFYDGPITANGMPHHGHMLTFAIKDLFPRYWTMQGYQVQRSLGWDCQGIPVEYEIEKKLEFKEKKDIENFGIAKFNQLCRESVLEYKSAMIDLEEKMGRLTDDKEEYSTMDADYIESIWWSLSEIYKKDLLYEGFKVVPYSTRAGTSLSNAEVALGGYKKVVDKAVTIKFELEDEPGTFVLAWTTTPWTLPTNFGLAVGRDLEYIKITSKNDGINYIIAKELAQNIFGTDYSIVESYKGSELVGKKYKPLFDYFVGRENCFQIYEGFHVTAESGTGIVHLAPYGAEDCEIFKQVGIEAIDVLNSQGDYTSEINDMEGVFYKAANKKIIEKLSEKNLMYNVEDYEHDVPMCWRTNTPLIYKPITSWYIAMSKLRGQLLANNAEVNWIPSHVKEGRFGHWLAEIKDWGISRLRYWGTPLPIWKTETGKVKVIGSYKELSDLSGELLDDPHRPFIDDVKFEIDGELYTRIPDVIDVWYDSGAMPFARFHYPFENQDLFKKKFPAEFIAEGVDQTRGWFYSLMAISTAVFGETPYKNVVINGFTLDDKGVKVSKSKKNYDAPDVLFDEFGADTIRANYFSTPIVAGEDCTITAKTLRTTTQEFTLPLWNIYVYLTTYAELFNFEPDLSQYTEIYFESLENPLDKWLVARLTKSTNTVIQELDKFNIQKSFAELKSTIDELSTWWIRRSRDRFSNGDKVVLEILYYAVLEISKLLAPFCPFLTERIYQDIAARILPESPESIHLCDYPIAGIVDQNLLDQMKVIQDICSLGLKVRSVSGVKLRQPLASVTVQLPSSLNLTSELLDIVTQELNVKEIILGDSSAELQVTLDTTLTPELEAEGLYRELARQIQSARKNAGLNFGQLVEMQLYLPDDKLIDFVNSQIEVLKKELYLSEINIAVDVELVTNGEDFKVGGVKGKIGFEI